MLPQSSIETMPFEILGPSWGSTHPSTAPGRHDPATHCGCGRTGPYGRDLEELALPFAWGWWSQWSGLTKSATTQIHIQDLSWSSPISTHLWLVSMWRNWSCGTTAVGSPYLGATAEYLKGVLVRVQNWWCTRSQRPWTRPATHCNEHLQVKPSE